MTETVLAAIGGYSPVSYFESGKAEQGHAAFQATHNGQTYFFTNADQVAKFQASPEKYAPAFAGQCAFGHTIGKELDVDPTNFKIVDGQLLLFLKNAELDAKTLWEKEGDAACMVKAKQHWQQTRCAC